MTTTNHGDGRPIRGPRASQEAEQPPVARASLVLAIGVLLLTTGCIGPIAGLTESTPAEDDARAAVPGSDTSLQDPPFSAPGTRTLSLVVELQAASRLGISVHEIRVSPAIGTTERLVENPGRVDPGDQRYVFMLAMEDGRSIPPLDVELLISDGQGLTRAEITLDAWSAEHDARQVLTLYAPEPGAVDILGLTGPLDAETRTERPTPLYGMLVWPDGQTRVLDSFPYRVHVPEGFPNEMPPGASVAFWIEDPNGKVSWTLDGDTEPGARFETALTPGTHALRVSVGDDGDRLELPFSIDDHRRYNGTVLVGTEPFNEDVPANSEQHPLPVVDDAELVWIDLRVTGDTPDQLSSRLNLSLLDEEGHIVAEGEPSGVYRDRIRLSDGLPAGAYEISIRGEQDVAIDYVVEAQVIY